MGCMNSLPRTELPGAPRSPGKPKNVESTATTPSATGVTEGVLSEMMRYRRPSIRNTGHYEALRTEEIAVMALIQSTEENTAISSVERQRIVAALKHHVLFSYLDLERLEALAKFMVIQVTEPGERVIVQGEIGDRFYIVRSGTYDVVNAQGAVINRLETGAAFGELGLLYAAARTATVIAHEKVRGSLYALRGKFYRYISAQQALGAFQSSLDALRKVELLQPLTDEQLRLVANAVQSLRYRAGTTIVRKGDTGSILYMILSGTVACTDIGSGVGAAATIELNEGNHFGERALLASEPRAATVTAKTDVRVLALDAATFQSVLGPLQQVLTNTRVWRALESVEILNTLPYPLKRRLLDAVQITQFESHDIIMREGESGDTFYIIKDGEVRVLRAKVPGSTSNEEEQPDDCEPPRRANSLIPKLAKTMAPPAPTQRQRRSLTIESNSVEVARLGPGETFGEMALLQQCRRQATVVAATRVECLVLSRQDFEDICGSVRDELLYQADHRARRNADKSFSQSITIDSIEHLRVIGVGSYGLVYLAKHAPTQRYVAVKEMWKARLEHSRQVAHICSEKRLLEAIDSPFVLQLYAALQDASKLYFVTEFLAGGELFQRLVTPAGLPLRLSDSNARFYTACCISALEYLHERNIAFRDLKPENILINAQGYAKLVDFGFSKKLSGKSYTLCGTPEYLAPELILGSGHNTSADCWALGILLYEMLEGDSPFAGGHGCDHLVICRNILRGNVPFRADAEPTWKELVLALLQRSPDQRVSMVTGASNDVRQCAWFAGWDWRAFQKQQLPVPWKPDISGDGDTKFFSTPTVVDLQEFDSWRDVPPSGTWDDF